jgi:DNA-binding response OmpR family regulator
MGRARILIIEDEEPIRAFMRRVLEPNYDVTAVADGPAGLKQARWLQPELILLDLGLPGGPDGMTVLAKLKADTRTRGIPVVIVSGRGDTEALAEGQRFGAEDHLIKPFNIDDLREVIIRRLALRQARPDAGEGRAEHA